MIVSLMKKKFVDEYHWIEEEEMLDLVAIAQSAPGAIAVNGAIVIGYKLAGIAGILTAIAGTVIPPFLIISILSAGYQAFRAKVHQPWLQTLFLALPLFVRQRIAAKMRANSKAANSSKSLEIMDVNPSEFTSAPPELPWLIEASVCRKFCRPVGFRPIRPVALIMPWVMVCPRL